MIGNIDNFFMIKCKKKYSMIFINSKMIKKNLQNTIF